MFVAGQFARVRVEYCRANWRCAILDWRANTRTRYGPTRSTLSHSGIDARNFYSVGRRVVPTHRFSLFFFCLAFSTTYQTYLVANSLEITNTFLMSKRRGCWSPG